MADPKSAMESYLPTPVTNAHSRLSGAGSQAGPTLVPGYWYTITNPAAIRVKFAATGAGAPTATATDVWLPAGRTDFVALVGQEQVAMIDAAGGTIEAFIWKSGG